VSLSAAERAELARLSAEPLAAGCPAIHFLAALYTRFGTQAAREVTDVIAQSTSSMTAGYFSGFIAGSDSTGFSPLVADPDITNPQTGHFFSFAKWALDGISEFETAAALGHEFVTDGFLVAQADQLIAGVPGARDFRDMIIGLPLDPRGDLDYGAMDSEFSEHGWTERIVESEVEERNVPGLPLVSRHEYYTGNSIADLRCTVAGFHFGRLVRSGLFATAVDATAWLTRNVLDGPCRVSISGRFVVTALPPGGR
jgi:hypothetical protein